MSILFFAVLAAIGVSIEEALEKLQQRLHPAYRRTRRYTFS